MKRKCITHMIITRALCLALSFILAFNGIPFEIGAEMLDNIFALRAEAAEAIDLDIGDFPVVEILNDSLQDTIEQIAAGGTDSEPARGRITLDKDYAANISVPDNSEIVLDLCGHKINMVYDTAYAATVTVYGTLKVIDTAGGGAITSDGVYDMRGVDIVSGGRFLFFGGSLDGFYSASNGAGIFLEENGYLNLAGGKVVNCRSDQQGGGIFISNVKDVCFSGGEVSSCSAENGGGIAVYKSGSVGQDSNLKFFGVLISENTATNFGGGFYADNVIFVDIEASSFLNNTAQNGGGLYFNRRAELTVNDGSAINDNTASSSDTSRGRGGGAFFNIIATELASSFTINGGTINNNTADYSGGGICISNTAVPLSSDRNKVTINGGEISSNISLNDSGGGLFIPYCSDTIVTGGSVNSNKAMVYGAGLYIAGGDTNRRPAFNMTGGEICENYFDDSDSYNDSQGAGIYIGSWAVIDISAGEISRNKNARYGGGIATGTYCNFTLSGTAEICENSMYHPTTTSYGGGIYMSSGNANNPATFEMTGGSVCRNNNNNAKGGQGGGLYISATESHISGGEIKDNVSHTQGGGLYIGKATIDGDTVISGNTAYSDGGGIYTGSPLKLDGNVIIENNTSSGSGGGVCTYNSAPGTYRYSFEMGGDVIIRNNKANTGGGVFAGNSGNWSSTTPSTYTMSITGGTLAQNYAAGSGGGLYFRNSDITSITGGNFIDNNANYGGGIFFTAYINYNTNAKEYQNPPTLKLSNAVNISGNTARTHGGGIYTEYYTRIVVSDGTRIINNTANSNGGGIYLYGGSNYEFKENKTESLEIQGGEIRLNTAMISGRDIFVNEAYPVSWNSWPFTGAPYTKIVKASDMENATESAYWLDEETGEKVTAAINTKEKVDSHPSVKYSIYTFNDEYNEVAKVGSRVFNSIQAAVDAINSHTVTSTHIELLKSNRETVVIPEGVTCSLDLCGNSVFGESSAVFTVESGAEITITDSVGGSLISDGKGQKLTANNDLYGGGFVIYGKVTISGIKLTMHKSVFGRVAYVKGGTLEMIDCRIENNNYSSSYNGSCIRGDLNSSVKLTNVVFDKNTVRAVEVKDTASLEMTSCEVMNQTASALVVNSSGTVNVRKCSFHDNTASAIQISTGCNVLIDQCDIRNNTAGNGAGIYNYGIAHIENTIITDNKATGYGGGLCMDYSNRHTYIKNSKIYNNISPRAPDVYLVTGAYFHTSDATTDSRVVSNWGVDGINCWYDDPKNTYIVEDNSVYSGSALQVLNLTDLFDENDKALGPCNLKADIVPDQSNYVAEIIQTGEKTYTLKSAFKKAQNMTEDVDIRLLADVSERVMLSDFPYKLSLDLNGHTIRGIVRESEVLYIKNSDFTLKDSAGGGKIIPPDKTETDISKIRGIYVTASTFTMESGEISGFEINGANDLGQGAAIRVEAGTVSTPSKIYIKGGVFKDNYASGDGGAIWANSPNSIPNVFVISGGTFINNEGNAGGAVYYESRFNSSADSVFTISGGTFKGNKGRSNGGAVYYYNGNAACRNKGTIYGVTFEDNISLNNGGAVYCNQPGTQTDGFVFGNTSVPTIFKNNTAAAYGAFYCPDDNASKKPMTVQNLKVFGNRSKGSYGAAYVAANTLVMKDCNFYDNSAESDFSAVRVTGKNFTVENCSIYNNVCKGYYGALYVSGSQEGEKYIKNCRIHDNRSSNNGAGIYDDAYYDIHYQDCEVYNNNSTSGNGGNFRNGTGNKRIYFEGCDIYGSANGAIFAPDSRNIKFYLRDTLIHDNSVTGEGGAIYIYAPADETNSEIIIEEGTVISNNRCTSGGGAVNILRGYNFTMTGGAIRDNYAAGSGGGVIARCCNASSTCTITGGVIEGNTATGSGGGLYILAYPTDTPMVNISGAKIRNNTCTNNSTGNGLGGGIYLGYYATATGKTIKTRINDTEISGNRAKYGGGMYVGAFMEDVIVSGSSVITNNSAEVNGGGVYINERKTSFTLSNKQLYGNHAMLGNDAYIAYHNSYRTSALYLMKPSLMFSEADGYEAIGWLEEVSGATYTESIRIKPLGRYYAYTLSYRSNSGNTVAVYNGTEYTSLQGALDAVEQSSSKEGEITLVDDAVESVTVATSINVTLNLNGHLVRGVGASAVTNRGNLTIIDAKKNITVGEHSFPMVDTEGRITGTAAKAGGGVNVLSGTVTLKSGSICDCLAGSNTDNAAYGGGGVAVGSGEFILDGGTIRDNVARRGGGVSVMSVSAKFTMKSGSIINNKTMLNGDPNTSGYGGGIYNVGGKVTIISGTLSGNAAYSGGAIYNDGGTTAVIGADTDHKPLISGNTAGYNGGGISAASGSLITSNIELSNNRTTYPMHQTVNNQNVLQSSGGGIYVSNANAIIGNGSVIRNNSAIRGGGIYQYRGTVQISGEHTCITANSARMGGGCGQYPLPGVSTVSMNLTDNASVYGNKSTLTSSGNDFYSAWEGSGTYREALGANTANVPRLNLIPAAEMNSGLNFNVWKNDAYDGEDRTGSSYVSGQYVTAEIEMCNNVQLTAAYYKVQSDSNITSDFKVTNVGLSTLITGTPLFDDGLPHSGYVFDDASVKEIFARDTIGKGGVEIDETYVYNGVQYKYIEYKGERYEQDQAIEWWPGDDFNDTNSIVRSFDNVVFGLAFDYAAIVEQEELPYLSNCRVKLKMILPCNSDDASFDDPAKFNLLNAAITPGTDEHGNEIQTLTGYWELNILASDSRGHFAQNVSIKVNGMKNGSTFKPTFECWFEGNDVSPHGKCASKMLTVSAAPKLNITLLNNEKLTYLSSFDLVNGVEASSDHPNSPDIIDGVMLGYGVTVEMYNDPTLKEMKGLELPKDGLNFDLSFNGKMYNEYGQEIQNAVKAPIIWAYKENDSTSYGRKIGESVNIINMDWADDDSMDQLTHYAYKAAPYNTGSNNYSCYNGGGWTLSDQRQTGNRETTVHATINGFSINGNALPTANAPNSSSNILSSGAVKAFSAGYIQVLLPLDNINSDNFSAGDYRVGMNAVASGLEAVSISGQNVRDVQSASSLNTEQLVNADLNYMNEYYHFEELQQLVSDDLAVGERRYADNYISIIRNMEIGAIGEGYLELNKRNIFYSENDTALNGTTRETDTGKGDTPINSVVYIEGSAYYHCSGVDTSDPSSSYYMLDDELYDSEIWNLIEYDYITALNILQKFDADAYTPVGAPPVVKTPSSQLKNVLGDSFIISTTETPATWSNTATTNYDLTILYAAKPDKTNWTKASLTDTEVAPNIVYKDGGTADMDLHREENLIYFKTLDDLHAYLGDDAPCVAILYEFRNCCFRTERSVSVKSKMNVTGEFEKVGQTYCTTNDVRAWTTYRPHFKVYYASGTQKDHVYGFDWADQTYSENVNSEGEPCEGLTVYGAALQKGRSYSGNLPYYTQTEGGVEKYPVTLETYADNYIKTRYRNGIQVQSSHNGMQRGNTLLLYSLDTELLINIETKQKNSNTPKDKYKINEGERDVTFSVQPLIDIASDAKKTELIRNGTQQTELTITLNMPEHLHYQKGSVRLDYSDPLCGYAEGGLEWTETYDPVNEKVYLTTYISDIDPQLPLILFDCKIGDENNPDNDIKQNGLSLPVVADISAKYSSRNIMAANMKTRSVAITALLTSQEGISKAVEERQYEIGEDITFLLTYGNNVDAESSQLETFDVLPHNEDGRGTAFSGGYNVKAVSVIFTSETDYDNYKSDGTVWFPEHNAVWNASQAASANAKNFVTPIMNSAIADTHVESSPTYDDGNYTVTYSFEGQNIGITRFNADTTNNAAAPTLFTYIPTIQGKHRVIIKVVITPMEGTDLIQSTGPNNEPSTQIGGDTYGNCFFYRKGSSGTYSDPLISNDVSAYVVKRIISGTVWMDQDQDGFYNTPVSVEYDNTENGKTVKAVEHPIRNIRATLRYANDNGSPNLTTPVKNILGIEVSPVYTDENGYYEFENLAKGDYVVVFDEDASQEYKFLNGEKPEGIHPIEFNKLSVTTDEHQLTVRGNKSEGVYDASDIAKMDYGVIGRKISLPEKTKIPGAIYTSPNWNLGLYYIDFTVHKRWGNMKSLDDVVDVVEGTSIKFKIEGREESSGTLVYSAELQLEKTADGIVSTFSKGGDISVSESADGDAFEWSFGEDAGIYLQGRNKNGVIKYAFNETDVRVNNVDIAEYYTMIDDTYTDEVTKEVTLPAKNDRILGSVTINKTTGGGDILEGAEFSIYQVSTKRDPDDHTFYYYNSSVGTPPLDVPFGTRVTKKHYKVILGGQDVIRQLTSAGIYVVNDNVLTSGTDKYIVHKEQPDSNVQYYYYAETNTPFSYEYLIGNVDRFNALKANGRISLNNRITIAGRDYAVLNRPDNDGITEYYVKVTLTPSNYSQESIAEFPNLPLVDENGDRIYYTVRETKVPEGFYSLADFNLLTGMDLFNGGATQQHDFMFEIENTRNMELPVTGGSRMRTIVMIGTILVTLGSAAIILMLNRKKLKEVIPRINL